MGLGDDSSLLAGGQEPSDVRPISASAPPRQRRERKKLALSFMSTYGSHRNTVKEDSGTCRMAICVTKVS